MSVKHNYICGRGKAGTEEADGLRQYVRPINFRTVVTDAQLKGLDVANHIANA